MDVFRNMSVSKRFQICFYLVLRYPNPHGANSSVWSWNDKKWLVRRGPDKYALLWKSLCKLMQERLGDCFQYMGTSTEQQGSPMASLLHGIYKATPS